MTINHFARRIFTAASLGVAGAALVLPAAAGSASAAPVAATHTLTASPTHSTVERSLSRLGMPVGNVDGVYDAKTRRALCTWRTAQGRPATRSLPTPTEARQIVAETTLPTAPAGLINGVDVSITCQASFWVENGHIKRVMAASTGKPGHATRQGTHRIFRSFNTWRGSTIYTGARMYKPMQFDGGEALHGSSTDALVHTYPASHGCVRMLHRDIDALHAGGVGIGTQVKVFGNYAG